MFNINRIPTQTERARMLENQVFTATMPKFENVTDKYRFIPSGEFIRDVESFGYQLVETRAPRSGLGTHGMVFTHPGLPTSDGLSMRMLATNSHDATSAFRLYIEVLVQVCSNGAVAWRPDDSTGSRVVHRGYALDKVKDALQAVQARFGETLETIKHLKDTFAEPERTAGFLENAATLRDVKPYKIIDLQVARHREQSENTAWNVFNRVQESLIRGRFTTQNTIKNVQGVDIIVPGRKARELTALKDKVQVNREVWRMAVEAFLNK